ncbi:MAG: hypothetical protein HC905_09480, partial [Bacteroidales bacterium]|nr:hypothetical protein [Bacteroidales bacterium]
MLTLQKYSSILTLYKFDHTGIADSHIIDLSRYRFANSSRNKLYTVVSDSVNNTDRLMLSKVRTNIPNTFDEVLNGGKLYIENGKMILTLDNSTRSTILITVRLDDFTCKLSSFQQLNTSCDDKFTRSNSFLYRGYLYQVKFCNEEIHFQVYDTCKKEVIKRHLVNPENFDIFRNTIISRVGTGKESITADKITFKRLAKDLDSAKVAIRKITKGQPGISVFGPDDQPVVTIGGQNSFYMTLGGSPMGGYGTTAAPGYYGSGLKLQSEWANYFRTLLNKNFDHQEGEIITTAYDDLVAYAKSNNKKELAELLFVWRNQYVLGYYDNELKQYSLVS